MEHIIHATELRRGTVSMGLICQRHGIVEGIGIHEWPCESEILHGSRSRVVGIESIPVHSARACSRVSLTLLSYNERYNIGTLASFGGNTPRKKYLVGECNDSSAAGPRTAASEVSMGKEVVETT